MMLDVSETSLGIRAYQPQDLPHLHAIDEECFPRGIAYSRAELLFHLLHPDSLTWVAEQDGKILGFTIGRMENPNVGHVLTLDVTAGARRQGIGGKLMSALEHLFRSRGADLFYLEVDVKNAAAQAFYERLGYTRHERVSGYYNGGSDAFRMVRYRRKQDRDEDSSVEA